MTSSRCTTTKSPNDDLPDPEDELPLGTVAEWLAAESLLKAIDGKPVRSVKDLEVCDVRGEGEVGRGQGIGGGDGRT